MMTIFSKSTVPKEGDFDILLNFNILQNFKENGIVFAAS
jgi:hypothetical protein